MEKQRRRSEFAPGQVYDRLVTDSMILSEQYVDSAIGGDREDFSDPHRAPQGILNGLILSLVLWALILLPFFIL